MSKSDRADKIEAWLLGNLPPQEADQLEQMMAEDTAFAHEVSLHKLALQAGKNLSDQHLKSQVLQWLNVESVSDEPKDTSNSGTDVSGYSKWITLFLLCATLALLGYIWFQNRNQAAEKAIQMALATENANLKSALESQKAIIAGRDTVLPLAGAPPASGQTPESTVFKPLAFYKAPTDWNTTMRSGDTPAATAELLASGVAAFRSGKNMTAERNAKSVLANDPSNRDAHRLLAHALMRQEHYLEASHEFNWLSTAFPSKKEEAEWNLLLCYKALSGTEEGARLYAKTLKQILDNQEHSYYKKAKAIRN